MASDDIGIVVPVFNTPPGLLAECLASAADQRRFFPNGPRVVVVDDGSGFHARRAIARACLQSAIRNLDLVTLHSHSGMAAARNEGVGKLGTIFALLLDSDDILEPFALSKAAELLSPHIQLLYADHIWCEVTGEVISLREKGVYHRLLAHYAGTKWSPFLHATFLFHPQIYRVSTFCEFGGLNTSWGYGDEIELHLAIEAKYGYEAFAYLPAALYRYRRNPKSVVHQPRLYELLISNIETILLNRMRVLAPDALTCKRIGRARSTHAAHYSYQTEDGRLDVPWFDFENCDVIS